MKWCDDYEREREREKGEMEDNWPLGLVGAAYWKLVFPMGGRRRRQRRHRRRQRVVRRIEKGSKGLCIIDMERAAEEEKRKRSRVNNQPASDFLGGLTDPA